jgi:hypothetical protein
VAFGTRGVEDDLGRERHPVLAPPVNQIRILYHFACLLLVQPDDEPSGKSNFPVIGQFPRRLAGYSSCPVSALIVQVPSYSVLQIPQSSVGDWGPPYPYSRT